MFNGITASYDDVITKNGGAQFYGQILVEFENKWNGYKISSKQDVHLKFAQNVIHKMVDTLQKENIIFFKLPIFSIFICCSQTMKE